MDDRSIIKERRFTVSVEFAMSLNEDEFEELAQATYDVFTQKELPPEAIHALMVYKCNYYPESLNTNKNDIHLKIMGSIPPVLIDK